MFNTDSPYNTSVCVSRHNKIPYIDEAPKVLNIQNETINGPKNYETKFINIGSDVTEEQPQGPVHFNSGNITLTSRKLVLKSETTISSKCNLKAVYKFK